MFNDVDVSMDKNQQMNVISEHICSYMNKVFMKVCFGILVTFAMALVLNISGALMNFSSGAFLAIMIGQLVLVLIMNFAVGNPNIPYSILNICYFVYSALTGITVAFLLAVFSVQSVINALLATALLFATLAVMGYNTKRDLSNIGSICIVGLIVCIVLSFLNVVLFRYTMFDVLIDIAVVIIFCGLTMYDVQKIKSLFVATALSSGFAFEDESIQKNFTEKVSVMGAFTLYLDFINLFIRLLSLFGKRR